MFPNDYAAVKEDQEDYVPEELGEDRDREGELLQAEGVKGKCYVICFNPKHNL